VEKEQVQQTVCSAASSGPGTPSVRTITLSCMHTYVQCWVSVRPGGPDSLLQHAPPLVTQTHVRVQLANGSMNMIAQLMHWTRSVCCCY
jgi:hypothetical protein